MFTVHETSTAILLCILTMIGWGSWANTQKLAGREKWPFELFYWDYAIGVALAGFVLSHTLGASGGAVGMSTRENIHAAAYGPVVGALLSGVVFNAANILLVAAIDAAGMSIAFPVGIGLALVLGTAISYWQVPKGNVSLLAGGVIAILAAMLLSTLAYRKLPSAQNKNSRNGLLFAIAAGVMMGFFYPQLMRQVSPDFNNRPIEPGMLTPYAALAFFGLGVLVSNIPFNAWFMRSRHSSFRDYRAAPAGRHWPGILGGGIWMTALCLNVVASGVAGPAISYALGQGATLIAALWGVFVWREFRGAPQGTYSLLAAMLAAYALGIILIGLAIL